MARGLVFTGIYIATMCSITSLLRGIARFIRGDDTGRQRERLRQRFNIGLFFRAILL
jgi:hypothetical protein